MAEIIQNKILNTMDLASIQAMIYNLEKTNSGEELKNAMDELQQALLQNPDACALMLPEDIGMAVKHLMRLTGQEIAAASEKKRPKKADLSAEKLKSLEDELFDEDL